MKLSLAPLAIVPVVALTLAGCSYVNPITTQQNYAPSDGFQAQLGDVAGLNLLVVTTAEGEDAVLIGTLVNEGGEDATVELSFDAGATFTDVDVAAGASVPLGPEGELVEGTALAAPGRLTTLQLGSGGTAAVQVDVPVVDGTLDEYAAILEQAGL